LAESPIPNVLLLNTGSGWLVSGAMVREMTIQSLLKCKGTTGWMLRTFCARLNGPTLKLVLFWNGTLIRSAMGFCASLARFSLPSSVSGYFSCPGEPEGLERRSRTYSSHPL
jgi:hypothetical protein